MKTNVIFLTCMVVAGLSFAQNQTIDFSIELDETVVIPPKFCAANKFIQGETFVTIDEFLRKNIIYPDQSASCGYFGTELVKFRISPKGEFSNFEVINSVCKKMDDEVIKVLELTNGMWKPATVNGKPVAMDVEVSVIFALNPTSDFVAMAKNCMKKGNQILFEKRNPKRALKYYDMGINFLPNNETLLAVRGLCKYEMGDETGASRDWERLKLVAERNGSIQETENLAGNFNASRGYTEMVKTLKK